MHQLHEEPDRLPAVPCWFITARVLISYVVSVLHSSPSQITVTGTNANAMVGASIKCCRRFQVISPLCTSSPQPVKHAHNGYYAGITESDGAAVRHITPPSSYDPVTRRQATSQSAPPCTPS